MENQKNQVRRSARKRRNILDTTFDKDSGYVKWDDLNLTRELKQADKMDKSPKVSNPEVKDCIEQPKKRTKKINTLTTTPKTALPKQINTVNIKAKAPTVHFAPILTMHDMTFSEHEKKMANLHSLHIEQCKTLRNLIVTGENEIQSLRKDKQMISEKNDTQSVQIYSLRRQLKKKERDYDGLLDQLVSFEKKDRWKSDEIHRLNIKLKFVKLAEEKFQNLIQRQENQERENQYLKQKVRQLEHEERKSQKSI